jgi:hypothetical protein
MPAGHQPNPIFERDTIEDQPTRVGATKGGCEAPHPTRRATGADPSSARHAPRRRVLSLPHCANRFWPGSPARMC